MDSIEGQKICKKYLNLIEKLSEVNLFYIYILKSFNIKTASRDYINQFSKAYEILYKEGTLCYLTEILDSAQEGSNFY